MQMCEFMQVGCGYMKKTISLSVLDAVDKEQVIKNIKDAYEKIKNVYDEPFLVDVHLDVMDNKFVPNSGIDLECIKIVKKYGLRADVHLMVEKPIEDGYIKKSIEYGADRISIHYEIDKFDMVLNYLNTLGCEIGIAIKPKTNIKNMKKLNDKFSCLLVMSVNPGLGGQKYITITNDKIENIKAKSDKYMQIDGGVNFDTITKPLSLGVDNFVIGSYLSKADNLESRFIALNIQKDILDCPRTDNIEFQRRVLQIVDGGYAKDDNLLGIRVPLIRVIAKRWRRFVNLEIILAFLSSKIHEFRQFAIFSLEHLNIPDEEKFSFINENIKFVNNWDLTDIVAPNIIGKYLITIDEATASKYILDYMDSKEVWIKRIGIVSLLEYSRKAKVDFVLNMLENVLYEKYHLYQKASGWVLREAYKKDSLKVVDYLTKKNSKKKLPSILLSYACERMSEDEKNKIKERKK